MDHRNALDVRSTERHRLAVAGAPFRSLLDEPPFIFRGLAAPEGVRNDPDRAESNLRRGRSGRDCNDRKTDGCPAFAQFRDVRDDGGRVTSAATAEQRDRNIEQALGESEKRSRMLLGGLEDYAIFMVDAQVLVMSWNAGAERIQGHRADEIIGRNFACFFPQADVASGREHRGARRIARRDPPRPEPA